MKTKRILLASTLVLLASCSNSDSFENRLQMSNMSQIKTSQNSEENKNTLPERASESPNETNDASKIMLGSLE